MPERGLLGVNLGTCPECFSDRHRSDGRWWCQPGCALWGKRLKPDGQPYTGCSITADGWCREHLRHCVAGPEPTT